MLTLCHHTSERHYETVQLVNFQLNSHGHPVVLNRIPDAWIIFNIWRTQIPHFSPLFLSSGLPAHTSCRRVAHERLCISDLRRKLVRAHSVENLRRRGAKAASATSSGQQAPAVRLQWARCMSFTLVRVKRCEPSPWIEPQ